MIGQSISHYRITAKLGQGGMGEVYRATDTKLDREVAIKVLPDTFTGDPQRLGRFEREAKVLASLDHPNVASIYGIEESDGRRCLVLQLVEGETLAARLKRGALPVPEALEVCRAIATALEVAHEKGVIHRDIKPGNVMLTPGGQVKVLDFGLAKVVSKSSSAAPLSTALEDSPTVFTQGAGTMPGIMLGTAAYMSPEQARAQEVDRRTDVWAFGCCLYECLSGVRPFQGDTVTDLVAAVLRSEPDWNLLPQDTPREVVTLVRRCLEKEPRRRLRSIGDIAITLEETSRIGLGVVAEELKEGKTDVPRPIAPPGAKETRGNLWWRFAALSGVAAAVVLTALMFRQGNARPQIRSIAVLQFENLKREDSDSQYLATTLQQALKERLGTLDQLNIKAKGATDVDTTVRGTFVRVDNSYHVAVAMIDEASQSETPLGSYTCSLTNIFPVQQKIATAVSERIRGRLSDQERSRLAESLNVDPEAYIAYHKGINALDVIGFANAETVIAHFESAINQDPGFLPPYIQQAWALWWPTIYGTDSLTSQQAFDKALALLADAERAFPDEPIIGVTRSFFRVVSHFDFLTAKTTLESALLTAPNDPDLYFMYLWYLVLIEARYSDAMRAVNQAIAVDPDRIALYDATAEVYSFMGNEREALKRNSAIAEENPADFDRLVNNALSHLNLGEPTLALQHAKNAVQVSANHPAAVMVLAETHAAMDETNEVRRLLQEVEAKRGEGHFIPHIWNARVEARLGDTEAALRSLRIAHKNREGWSFLYTLRNPHFTKLMSSNPGYWELIDAMGFPPLPMGHPYCESEQEMRFRQGPPKTEARATTPLRVEIQPEKGLAFYAGALSPDGRLLAVATYDEGKYASGIQLRIRPLGSLDSNPYLPLPGTKGVYSFFWSPDSRSLGFFVEEKLKRINLDKDGHPVGPPETICEATVTSQGTWGSGDFILFSKGWSEGLWQVPASGGSRPLPATELVAGAGDRAHDSPAFLPDGVHFVYTVLNSDPERAGLYLGGLGSDETERILPYTCQAIATQDGYLIYNHRGDLLVAPLDLASPRKLGRPRRLATDLSVFESFQQFSVSANGMVTFMEESGYSTKSQLHRYNEAGNFLGSIGPAGYFNAPELYPDERAIHVTSYDRSTRRFMSRKINLQTGVDLEFEDGALCRCFSPGKGAWVHMDPASGGLLLSFPGKQPTDISPQHLLDCPTDWSPDGRYILSDHFVTRTNPDIYAIDTSDPTNTFPVRSTPYREFQGRFSPDGNWVAFTSDQSGEHRVYVLPFPAVESTDPIAVSPKGGGSPRWSKQGDRLFYIDSQQMLLAVDWSVGPGGFQVEWPPQPIAQTKIVGITANRNFFCVKSDGEFLILNTVERPRPSTITLLQNWSAALQ